MKQKTAARLREMGGPEPGAGVLSSLTGLEIHGRGLPTDESVGYFRASLRDWGRLRRRSAETPLRPGRDGRK